MLDDWPRSEEITRLLAPISWMAWATFFAFVCVQWVRNGSGELGDLDIVHVAAENVRMRMHMHAMTPAAGLTLGGGGLPCGWKKSYLVAFVHA
jgi:hypothetical protein